MIVFCVLIAIASSLSLLYQVLFRRNNILLSKIPSPKKKFLLHNTFDFLGSNLEQLFKKFEAWHDDLGQIYHVTFHPFDRGSFFVGDAKIAEALSLHQPDRSRAFVYKAISRWIGANGFLLSPVEQIKNKIKPVLGGLTPKYYQRVNYSCEWPLAIH